MTEGRGTLILANIYFSTPGVFLFLCVALASFDVNSGKLAVVLQKLEKLLEILTQGYYAPSPEFPTGIKRKHLVDNKRFFISAIARSYPIHL